MSSSLLRFSVSACIKNAGLFNRSIRNVTKSDTLLLQSSSKSWISTTQHLQFDRELKTFYFSTLKKKFIIDVKEKEGSRARYLKINEFSNGKKSWILVEEANVQHLISNIEKVRQDKGSTSFPNGQGVNLNIEYMEFRSGGYAIKMSESRDVDKGKISLVIVPEEGIPELVQHCRDATQPRD